MTTTRSSRRTTPSAPSPMSSGRRGHRRPSAGSQTPLSRVPQASHSEGGSSSRGAGDSNARPTVTPGPAGGGEADHPAALPQRPLPGATARPGDQPRAGGGGAGSVLGG